MYLRASSGSTAGGFDKSGMRHLVRQAAKDLLDFVNTGHPVRCLVIFAGAVELRQVSHDKGQLGVSQVLPDVFDQEMQSLFIGIGPRLLDGIRFPLMPQHPLEGPHLHGSLRMTNGIAVNSRSFSQLLNAFATPGHRNQADRHTRLVSHVSLSERQARSETRLFVRTPRVKRMSTEGPLRLLPFFGPTHFQDRGNRLGVAGCQANASRHV